MMKVKDKLLNFYTGVLNMYKLHCIKVGYESFF